MNYTRGVNSVRAICSHVPWFRSSLYNHGDYCSHVDDVSGLDGIWGRDNYYDAYVCDVPNRLEYCG